MNTVFDTKAGKEGGGFLANKKIIAIAVIVVVVIAAVIIGLSAKGSSSKEAASDALSAAYTSLAQGNQEQGLTMLNDIVTKYPKTPAAYQAELFLGDFHAGQGNFQESLRFLSDADANAEPKELRPLALARIIFVWDIRNEFSNAKDASEVFVKKYPNHFLAKSIYISLARYYAILNNIDEVKRVCNEILIKFPGTEEATIADNTLKALG
jgi:TolA-binding protein